MKDLVFFSIFDVNGKACVYIYIYEAATQHLTSECMCVYNVCVYLILYMCVSIILYVNMYVSNIYIYLCVYTI